MRIVSLFDTTGLAGIPFFMRGDHVTIIDILNVGERSTNPYANKVYAVDILACEDQIVALKPDLLFGFPPCTDLTVAGARHFKEKAWANPDFQDKAWRQVIENEDDPQCNSSWCIHRNSRKV